MEWKMMKEAREERNEGKNERRQKEYINSMIIDNKLIDECDIWLYYIITK